MGADEFSGLLVDGGVTGQHVDVRNLQVVEQQKAVIHGVVAEFWTDVSDVDALEWLVGLEVTDLDDEWVWAVALAVKNQLCHNDRVGSGASQRADPPLGSREVWRVNNEGLVGWVPCGCGLETANVGAVAQLGLGVAANVFVGFGWLKEELLLLLGGLVLESRLKRKLACVQGAN